MELRSSNPNIMLKRFYIFIERRRWRLYYIAFSENEAARYIMEDVNKPVLYLVATNSTEFPPNALVD